MALAQCIHLSPSLPLQEILTLEQRLWRLRSDKARSALRDSGEPNYLNSPKRAAAPTIQRRYSTESQMTMDELAVVSIEAERLQRISEQAETQLRLAERFGEPVDPALRNQCGSPVILWPTGSPRDTPRGAQRGSPFPTALLGNFPAVLRQARPAVRGRHEASGARAQHRV